MYGDFAGMYDPLMKDVDYDSWAEYLLRFLGAAKAAAERSGRTAAFYMPAAAFAAATI